MNSTSFKTLAEVVNEYCTNRGRYHLHGWGRAYMFATEGLREAAMTSMPMRQVKPIWLPVENFRAWMPEGYLGITGVGVDIQGHFAPMLMDETMIDRPDDCGDFGDAPVDPDIPSIKVKDRQLPVLYTGSFGAYGFGGPGMGWSWGWATGGYWPGMDKRHSIYGYWRYFQDKGYILLSDKTKAETIVALVIPQPFEPGTINVIPEMYVEYLKAYIAMREARFRGDRAEINRMEQLFFTEKEKLRTRRDGGTYADLWVAAKGY